jgi:hypothetical protein
VRLTDKVGPELRAIEWLEGLGQCRKALTSSEIETGIFRLVASSNNVTTRPRRILHKNMDT